MTSKQVNDVSVVIVFRSVSIVALSSNVAVEEPPDGPRIRIRMVGR